MNKRKFINITAAAAAVIFVIHIISEPKLCTEGAAEGLLLSGRVIIPSLFPFTVCVLFILKSGALGAFKIISPFTKRIFHINHEMFALMLLSFIGGYPIGAKLLNEAVTLKKISVKNAGIMLNYCVNAGPAFVILAVGNGILGSKKVGYILLTAHIVSSFLLAFIFGFFIRDDNSIKNEEKKILPSATDNFVLSVSEASSAVLGICAYVIFFSTVTAYVNNCTLPFVKSFAYVLEVTNAVTLTENIIIISFLLGFGGLSVWFQVFSLGRRLKINIVSFALSRLMHGLLSAGITAVLLKIFRITVSVFSNGRARFSPLYGTLALSLSMFVMIVVFIISVYTKKHTGKILDDLL